MAQTFVEKLKALAGVKPAEERTAEADASALEQVAKLTKEAESLALAAAEAKVEAVVNKAAADNKIVPAQKANLSKILMEAIHADGGGKVAVQNGQIVLGEHFKACAEYLDSAVAHQLTTTQLSSTASLQTVSTTKEDDTDIRVAKALAFTQTGQKILENSKS